MSYLSCRTNGDSMYCQQRSLRGASVSSLVCRAGKGKASCQGCRVGGDSTSYPTRWAFSKPYIPIGLLGPLRGNRGSSVVPDRARKTSSRPGLSLERLSECACWRRIRRRRSGKISVDLANIARRRQHIPQGFPQCLHRFNPGYTLVLECRDACPRISVERLIR